MTSWVRTVYYWMCCACVRTACSRGGLGEEGGEREGKEAGQGDDGDLAVESKWSR